MIRFYFIFNAAVYGALALWCTLKHGETSNPSGYVALNNSGHSEYLVIYGGLQLGLALFYSYLGANPPLYRAGAIFSALLYGAIIAFRTVTVIKFWPVSKLTVGTGILEAALLVGAVIAVTKSTLSASP